MGAGLGTFTNPNRKSNFFILQHGNIKWTDRHTQFNSPTHRANEAPTRPAPYKDLAPKEAIFATADAFAIAVRRFEAKHGRSPRGHCRAVRDT